MDALPEVMPLLRHHFREVLHVTSGRSDQKGKIKTNSYVATAENDGTGKTKKRAAAHAKIYL